MSVGREADVLVLATLETKGEACQFLTAALVRYGVATEIVDLSLNAGGAVLDGSAKIVAMRKEVERAAAYVKAALTHRKRIVVAFGGGTGSQMAISVFKRLPFGVPKFLITTMPFDPRPEMVHTDIVIIPTIADIMGMNATLRTVLETTAALISGPVRMERGVETNSEAGVALTAMGVTSPGADQVVASLRNKKLEATVFHAVGFGGFALGNWMARGLFTGLLDFTPHEITRTLFADGGSKERFEKAAASGLPQVFVPGALNLHCLGPKSTVGGGLLKRPHYEHSAAFTHVQLSHDEMRQCARFVCDWLNRSNGPVRIIVPMGGFSSEDRSGGAIASPDLRAIFLESMEADLDRKVAIEAVDHHINDPAFADTVVNAYLGLLPCRRIQ
jgi:uncharacterized protein (UPF0261 family)